MTERVVHCWTGYGEWVEETYGFDEYVERMYVNDEPSATCMLPHGHDGPHVWTPNDQIIVGIRKGDADD